MCIRKRIARSSTLALTNFKAVWSVVGFELWLYTALSSDEPCLISCTRPSFLGGDGGYYQSFIYAFGLSIKQAQPQRSSSSGSNRKSSRVCDLKAVSFLRRPTNSTAQLNPHLRRAANFEKLRDQQHHQQVQHQLQNAQNYCQRMLSPSFVSRAVVSPDSPFAAAFANTRPATTTTATMTTMNVALALAPRGGSAYLRGDAVGRSVVSRAAATPQPHVGGIVTPIMHAQQPWTPVGAGGVPSCHGIDQGEFRAINRI